MMINKITVIMPCYNCTDTVRESLDSVLSQTLKAPLEIVAVDDGSTDETKDILVSYSKKHPEIKLFFHEKNLGGGAARNTAVKNSSGDLIYCQDSDDILGKDALNLMIQEFERNTGIDGVTFDERRYFTGNDLKHVEVVSFHQDNVEFKSMFGTKENPLIANFMYTRKSYDAIGGYPEHHGFDTQGFGIRWLSKGFKANVVKGAHYYHRRNPVNKKSYFEREYALGKISENQYYMFEEILHLFNREFQEVLLRFETKKFIDLDDSLMRQLQLQNAKKNIFAKDYESLLTPSPDNLIPENEFKYYWMGVKSFHEKKYEEALNHFFKARKFINYSRYLDLYLIKTIVAFGKFPEETATSFLENLQDFLTISTEGLVGTRQSLLQRTRNKIRKTCNKL